MGSVTWSEEQIQEAQKDFRVFLFMVWREINLPNPTPIQYDIADTLQNPPGDRFILEGFRGVAKSFIACAYCVWLLWREPEKKVLIVSASKSRADANAVFIRRIFKTMHFLEHLNPDNGDGRNTQNEFDLAGISPDISSSVKSVGITGQITGSRADYLLADDIEVANNSGTETQRSKLNEQVKEFDAILKPGGNIVFLGTPQNEMSIYNSLQKRGYLCRIFPILYPENDADREFYGDRLAHSIASKYDENPKAYAGFPTDPARFDMEEIDKRRLSYGKAGFSLQFMLNTDLSDQEKYPLKVSDLIVTSLDIDTAPLVWSWANGRGQMYPDLPCVALGGDNYFAPLATSDSIAPYTTGLMFVDPSGRGKDETAYAVIKYLNGYLFVLEVGGFKEGYEDSVLRQLCTKAKFYGLHKIIVEPNFGSGMFAQLLRPVAREIAPNVEVVDDASAKSQKEARIIDTLEPMMMKHKIVFEKQIILDDYKVFEKDEKYSLIYQMTRLSRDRGSLAHDDRIDALAGGVAYFLDMVAIDQQQGIDDLNDEQLEKWMDPDYGILYVEPDPTKVKSLKRKENLEGNFGNCMSHYYFNNH